jgi:hypothetical protein
MANPLVSQGTLNKLRASVQVITLPQLSFGASFLAPEGITLSFEGDASGYLATLTGAVPSPNPYMMANIQARLLKTQSLANLWKFQMELNTTIGDVNLIGDSSALGNYFLANCTLLNVAELSFNGSTPDFTINIRGTYIVNSLLFATS